MRVIALNGFGGPEVLQIAERPIPQIKETEVLIQVKSFGINRPDIFQRKGNYAAPDGVAADIPGLEVAGIVHQVGSQVSRLKVGDRVMALLAGGGYAEYAAVEQGNCILIPENTSYEEAAGMPETLFTVWHNVFQRGRLKAGEALLVHGGSGGIGTTAVQLGHLFGAKAYATVGSDEKKKFVESLGADVVINYNEADFVEALTDVKIDVVLDSIGGDYFNKNIQVLNEEGRLIQINAMMGAKVELNLFKLMQKRIFLSGSTLRNRSVEFKTDLANELTKNVLPLIESGKYKTPIARVFGFEEVKEAHEMMESRDFLGKIIVSI